MSHSLLPGGDDFVNGNYIIWKNEIKVLKLRKIEGKRSLFIPQIRKIKAERTMFIPQIGKLEA